jgi:8-oxo-dGTP pyrophosphatase MutT (NUDIX family)
MPKAAHYALPLYAASPLVIDSRDELLDDPVRTLADSERGDRIGWRRRCMRGRLHCATRGDSEDRCDDREEAHDEGAHAHHNAAAAAAVAREHERHVKRPESNDNRMKPRRKAAVALAIVATPPHGVLFVERAAHLRDHPGQIGLPGGSVDPSDGDDLARTALRELREEVGVAPQRVTIVGQLPEVRQRVNTFDVTPFVAVIEPGPFTIDGSETAGMFTIPLEIIVSDALRRGTIDVAERIIETYLLDYEGRRVWGLTGGILRSFVERWHDPTHHLRAAVEAAFHRG